MKRFFRAVVLAVLMLGVCAGAAGQNALAATGGGYGTVGEFIKKMRGNPQQVMWFMSMVGPGGEWDYKAEERRPGWAPSGEFELAGRTVNLHEYASVNFAFAGKAQGWTLAELYVGSAAVTWAAKGVLSAGDAGDAGGPGDQELLQWGYELYDQMMEE